MVSSVPATLVHPLLHTKVVNTMNQAEYLEEFIEAYGADYVEELIAKGFEPVLTSRGWRWIMVTKVAA